MVAVDELVRKATKAGKILTLVKCKLGSLNANSWKVTTAPPAPPLLLLIVRTPHVSPLVMRGRNWGAPSKATPP